MSKARILLLLLYSNICFASYYFFESTPYYYSNFKTISTKNFNISYPSESGQSFFFAKNIEEIAKRVAIYAENIHEILSKELGNTPYLKTEIVLIDDTDSTNGFATPVPQNIVYLYVTPPMIFGGLSEYRNWLKEVLIHELTHIYSLSSYRGYSSFLRSIFGTIVNINALWPLNLTEGIAVFEETKNSSGGRGRSTRLHTMLRTSTYYELLNPNTGTYQLSKTPYITSEWPIGDVPYLYGFLIFEHLYNYYDFNVSEKISKHSSGVIPYFPSYSFNHYLNKDIEDIWNEIIETKKSFYKEWIEYLEEIKEPKPLFVNRQYERRLPAIFKNYIAYYSSSSKHKDRIEIYDLKNKEIIKTIEAIDPSYIVWINNKLIFNKLDSNVGTFYYKTVSYNLKTKNIKEIKNSERLLYAYPITENTLCTIRAKTGVQTVNLEKLEDNKFTHIKTLYATKLLGRAAKLYCKKSNNSYEVFFINKDVDENEQIIKISENQKNITKQVIFESQGFIKDFSINGNKLTYISDEDGIYNIYEKDLLKNNTKRLTNLVSGAFDLINLKNNNLLVTYYTPLGYEIGIVEKNNYQDTLVFNKEDEEIRKNEIEYKGTELKKKSYSGFKNLIPKFWLPTVSFSSSGHELGAITYGSDSLFQNQYQISAAYNFGIKKVNADFSYMNTAFYPTYILELSQGSTIFKNNNASSEFESIFTTSVPIGLGDNVFWDIYGEYIYQYLKYDFINRRIRKSGLGVGIRYQNFSTSNGAISIEKGIIFDSYYRAFLKTLGSHSHGYETNINLKLYQPLWTHHVLYLNTDASYAYGNNFFSVGGVDSGINPSFDYLLRGYPQGSFLTNLLVVNNLEYRFPLWSINNTFAFFPLFLEKIHGALVIDNAFMGRDLRFNTQSVGLELKANITVGYHIPAILKAGIYKSIDTTPIQYFVGFNLEY